MFEEPRSIFAVISFNQMLFFKDGRTSLVTVLRRSSTDCFLVESAQIWLNSASSELACEIKNLRNSLTESDSLVSTLGSIIVSFNLDSNNFSENNWVFR